jgi:hypothetical protein
MLFLHCLEWMMVAFLLYINGVKNFAGSDEESPGILTSPETKITR